MRRVLFVWHDRDGSRTVHEFDTPADACNWLRSVLEEHCPADELEAGGYEATGRGMLCYYIDEGLDDVGSIEAFIGGIGVTPDEIQR